MNVLIIVENLPVPFDARVWQEAQALKECGHKVFVICPKGRNAYRERYQCLKGIHIYRHELPLEAEGPLGYILEYAGALYWQWKLAREVWKKHGFQVLQACNPPDLSYIIGRYYKKRHAVRFVFDHHDLVPELYVAKFGRTDLAHRFLLRCERRTFATADFSVATNESYREIALRRGRMPPQRVVVVRSGPSLERLYPVPAVPAWKRGKAHLIAYVGVIGKQEGLAYLLRAARCIRRVYGRTDVQFIIMGSGSDLEHARQKAVALGIDDMVEFTGRVSDEHLREVLSTADVCVNPDEYNEMNDKSTMNKVMEYMAMGKPIVQFDLAEGRVSAGESSLYCRRNDAEDMADKIVWLLDNPQARMRMGRFGKERIERELAWHHEKPKYVALFERIFGG